MDIQLDRWMSAAYNDSQVQGSEINPVAAGIDLLRTKHKNGENYYWLLYYSFLSPQQLRNVEEIIEKVRPHIRDISFRTYFQ